MLYGVWDRFRDDRIKIQCFRAPFLNTCAVERHPLRNRVFEADIVKYRKCSVLYLCQTFLLDSLLFLLFTLATDIHPG